MTDPDTIALPESLGLAWGRRDRPTRGPKRVLTLEQVVDAGIAVAAEEGLEGVSMARVAARLGIGTMSLYRYVSAKDDLLTLMVDAGLGRPPAAQPDDEPGWRAGLTRWAVGVRAAYRSHLWSTRVPITGPPLGPNNVAWLEYALQAMADTPLTDQQRLSTVLLLSGFVRAEAMLSGDIAAAVAAQGEASPPPGYGAVLRHLIDPAQFPAIDRAIESGSLDDGDDVDVEFDFGLERILDGVAALIAAQAQPRSSRARRRTT